MASHHRNARRAGFSVISKRCCGKPAAACPTLCIDQYYTGAQAVDPYHEVRREVFKGLIPPSTSNLHQRFTRAGQTIEVQAMAVIPGMGLKAEHQSFKPIYKIHQSSGYSPALSAGDFHFACPVRRRKPQGREGPIDPEARRPIGLWKGTPIKLETDFIVRRQDAALIGSGRRGFESVVAAPEIYLRDRDDVPGFNEVWYRHFKFPPATIIVPTAAPGFVVRNSRIEINVIAPRDR